MYMVFPVLSDFRKIFLFQHRRTDLTYMTMCENQKL